MVLEVDPEKRRISLGLKQCLGNPWEAFVENHPLGSTIEGEIKNITEFGLFVGLDNDIDGMVHLSDLDWQLPRRGGGQEVQQGRRGPAPRCSTSTSRRSASRSASSSWARTRSRQRGRRHQEGRPGDLHGQGGQRRPASRSRPPSGATGFIRKAELARDRDEQRPERFAAGEKLDAKVTNIDADQPAPDAVGQGARDRGREAGHGRVRLSDSGASLGDILGAAFRQKQEEQTKD